MSAEQQPITEVMGNYFNLSSVQRRYVDIAQRTGELHLNRTAGSDTPDLEGITIIPIGDEATGSDIQDALTSHVHSLEQDTKPRTQIVLSLNEKPGSSVTEAAEKEDAIRTFAAKNEDLPISFFKTAYPADTPRGVRLGDLTDAGLLWLLKLGRFTQLKSVQDFAVISNSIYEKRRSPGYENLMLNSLFDIGTIAVFGVIRYQRSGYTDISRLQDWLCLPSAAKIGDEANLAFSVKNALIPAEGYNRTLDRYPTHRLFNHAPYAAKILGKTSIKTVKKAAITLSSRRITEVIKEGVPPLPASSLSLAPPNIDEKSIPKKVLRRVMSDEDYLRWTKEYQLDLLQHGGAIVLHQGGREALIELLLSIESARTRLNGETLSGEEVGDILFDLLDKRE